MAVKSILGFEAGVLPPAYSVTDNTGITPVIASTGQRSGAYCLSLPGSVLSASVGLLGDFQAAANADLFIAGAGIYYSVAPGAAGTVAMSCNVGTAQAWVIAVVKADGTIEVWRGSAYNSLATLIGTAAAGSFVYGAWNYLVMEVLPASTAVGAVKLWVDGVLKVDVSSVVTLASASYLGTQRGFRVQRMTNAAACTSLIDDVMTADGSGAGIVAGFAPIKIEALRPTSDDLAGFTRSTGADNYALVDEAPVSGADYVSASAAGPKDRYGLGNRTLTGAVLAVKAEAWGIATEGGAAPLNVGLKSGATESLVAAGGFGAAPKPLSAVFETDPASGVAFTTADVNGLLVGIEAA